MNMTLVGRGLFGPSFDSEITGNTVYLAVGEGIQVIDVSNPNSPSMNRTMRTRDFIGGLALQGNILYVANQLEGLRLFNVTDPWNPLEVGSVSEYSFSVEVFDTLAFVGGDSLLIVNVADSSNPQLIGGYSTIGFPMDFVLQDTLLYVADNGNGLVILNVADPTNPVFVSTFPLVNIANVEISGDTVYTIDIVGGPSGTSWIRSFDVSVPTAPSLLNTLNFGIQNFAIPLSIEDSIAYVMKYRLVTVPYFFFELDIASVNLNSGLTLMDEETIGTVFVLTVPFFNPGFGGVPIQGDRIYVAANSEGLIVVDKSNPANLVDIGELDESSYYADVFFDGQYAYVAALGDGLIILDVLSNPNNPTIVGQFNPGDELKDVKVQGNKAYLASDLTGIRIVDITDPANPVEDTLFEAAGTVHNITVEGNRAYLSKSSPGDPMYIIDITDPSNVSILGTYFGGSSFIHDVFAKNDTAYVSHWGMGLRVVDVTNPALPLEIGAHNYSGSATHNAFLAGDYCYIEDEIVPGGFMRVVDVANPASPFQADSFIYSDSDPDGYAHNLFVQNDLLHISYADDGVVLVDVANPLSPTLVGFYDMLSYNWGVHPGPTHIYATDSHSGLWIFEFLGVGVEEENGGSELPLRTPSLSYLPNPTQNRTRINYSIPNPSEVHLKVYDLSGREVRTLVEGIQKAGSYTVEWDGKGNGGEKISSGIYFIRLDTEKFNETKKLVLLR
jgi:hypothetical protein